MPHIVDDDFIRRDFVDKKVITDRKSAVAGIARRLSKVGRRGKSLCHVLNASD
jgi:hypothetical protein